MSKVADKTNEIIADSSEVEFHTAKEGIRAVMDKVQLARSSKGIIGLNTGYQEIDAQLRGLQAGRVYIIAAPSGGGKSVLCMNIVEQQIHDAKRTAVFSAEMGHDEVWERIMIKFTDTSANVFAGKEPLNKRMLDESRKLSKMADEGEIDIITCDRGGQSIEQIVAAIHREHRKKPLELVVIDYIQLIHSQKRFSSREQEMAHISRALKSVARQLKIPIVMPCQLNDDGKARESRTILHDSDAFIKIDPEALNVEKNRCGPTGSIPYVMHGEFQKFIRVTNPDEPQTTKKSKYA
jgi:replicative DNA helicase